MTNWQPIFSIVHCTARPHGWQAAYAHTLRNSAMKGSYEYILCFDEAQREEFERVVPEEWLRSTHSHCSPRAYVHPGPREYVAAANWATQFANGKIIIEASDDMFCPPAFDKHLVALSPDPIKRLSSEFVIWVYDGIFRDIMTLQIFSRAWYERYGFVFNPAYGSMNADRDLSLRACRDGVVIDCRDNPLLHWDHQHHRNKKRRKDACDIPNESAERYCQGWKQLKADWPDHFKAEPLDALYASACSQTSDINEHLPYLKELASDTCWGTECQGGRIIPYPEDVDTEDVNTEECCICGGTGRIGKSILELGTRTGNSTIAFLAGRPKRLVSVDLDFSRLDPQVEGAAMYSEIPFKTIESDSIRAGVATGLHVYDVIFFDTLHTYAHLKAEIAAHAHNSTERLVFHDTVTNRAVGEDGSTPGLWAAIEELEATGEWEIERHVENNNGLTTLRRVK